MASLLKHTVKPSGGDFTTLSAAVAHIISAHANLVTADVYAEIEISGTWSSADTTQVSINNLTTDATRYLHIYATGDARHAGVWSTSKYQLVYTAAANTQAAIYSTNATALYAKIDGLQVKTITNGYSDDFGIYLNEGGASVYIISNSIIRGDCSSSAAHGNYGIHHGASNTGVTYGFNNVIYGWVNGNQTDGGAISQNGSSYWYNCTFAGNGFGLRRTAGTVVMKNCYADNTAGWDGYAYYGTITKTTCASEDASGTAGLTGIAVNTDTFVNVTAGSEDFHLAADGLSPLENTGTDTSGDSAPLNFTTDIVGESYADDWDIGAFATPGDEVAAYAQRVIII